MRNTFSTRHSSKTDLALLIARVGIALLMLTHGLPKMEKLLAGGDIQFASVFGMSPAVSLFFAVLTEVGCSLLLLLGLGIRLATVPLIITMLVAAFSIHAADPFSKQEPALQYLLVYIVLLLAGGGKYSVDGLLLRKRATSHSPRISGEPAAIPA